MPVLGERALRPELRPTLHERHHPPPGEEIIPGEKRAAAHEHGDDADDEVDGLRGQERIVELLGGVDLRREDGRGGGAGSGL